MQKELLSYLLKENTINGVPLSDLKGLFNSINKNFKNLNIKIEAQDSIVVYNRTTRSNIMLKCVCNYFDIKSKECMRIKDELEVSASAPCKTCFKKCLRDHALGTLNKK